MCVVNILLHKGSKSRKNSLGVKNRYSTMLSISTLYGRDFYLQKPLAITIVLVIAFCIGVAGLFALFVMIPYSKFIHVFYRFIALVKYNMDEQEA